MLQTDFVPAPPPVAGACLSSLTERQTCLWTQRDRPVSRSTAVCHQTAAATSGLKSITPTLLCCSVTTGWTTLRLQPAVTLLSM